jgi:two-component system, chemotaxis family, sensor kinase CheA
MSSRREALVDKFRRTCVDRVARVEAALTELERQPDGPEPARLVARELHTVKGEARLLGFAAIAQLAHALEELLPASAAAHWRAEAQAIELFFEGLDLLSSLGAQDPDAGASVAEAFTARAAPLAGPSDAGAPAPVVTPKPLELARADEVARHTVEVRLAKLEEVMRAADDVSLGMVFGEQALERLAAARVVADEIEQALADQDPARALLSAARGQQRLRRALDGIERWLADQLASTRVELARLEAGVEDLRLLPLAPVLEPCPRVARDIARAQSKRIRVRVEGADVEVDGSLASRIAEPLLHLVRNAVDHGIEPPDERRAAGKDPIATVEVVARALGSRVAVEVADDGRGIDVEALRRAADARGIEAPIGEADACELAFVPGLSSRTQVTDVSGRGVGLDVVRAQVQEVGGTVRLETIRGRGTRVLIDLPVSTMRLRALCFEASGGRYAIESSAVAAVAVTGAARRVAAGTGAAIRHGDRHVPLIALAPLLPTGSAAPATMALVLERGGRSVALEVERVLGEEVLVQRSLGPLFRGYRLATGSAIGRDGRLVVLLGAAELIHATRGLGTRARPSGDAAVAAGAMPSAVRVLVVDDSELTRDMLTSVARRAGYEVEEAVDGHDALERIARRRPDVVVTDLEMPVLDGFALLRELRARLGHFGIPVVVCSTRGSDADKRRAAELGADAYLVKSTFDEAELRALLERLTARAEVPA